MALRARIGRSRRDTSGAADLAGMADHELLGRHRAGASGAAAELMSRWRPGLVGYFLRHVHDEAAAEDLAHEVLTDVLSTLQEVDCRRPAWPWLMAIARRRLIDHYRHVRRPPDTARHARAHAAARPSPLEDFDHLVESIDAVSDRPIVRQVIGRLTAGQRFAILRHDVDDWTPDQIAAAMGISRQAVHALLHRARRSARREFLRLTGGRAPWAVVPWPLLWVRDRVRRLLQRVRGTVQEWQPTLPAAAESVTVAAGMAVTATMVVGVSWVSGGPSPAQAATPPASERVDVAVALDNLQEMVSRLDLGESPERDDHQLEQLRGASAPSGVPRAAGATGDPEADISGVVSTPQGPPTNNPPPDRPPPDPAAPEAPLPEAPVVSPDVDGPQADGPVEASVESSDSERFEDGQQTTIVVEGDTGTSVTSDGDLDCSRDLTRPACQPEEPVEDVTADPTDTSENEAAVTEGSVPPAGDDAPDGDEVDEAVSNELDSTLTEDNCGLDPTVGHVCDAADQL